MTKEDLDNNCKWVEGYEGLYYVTIEGEIFSVPRKGTSGGRLKSSLRVGYPSVCLYKNDVKKMHHVHRILAEAFIPNLDSKPEVNHKNGKTDDNRLDNLEWVTSSENKRHAIRTGLKKTKPKKVLAGLSERYKVRAEKMVQRYESGETLQSIADSVGLHRSRIHQIINDYKIIYES